MEKRDSSRKKIGLMGGTFDPIHLGHLILGEKSYEQLGLDEVIFMPAGNPPHKPHREGRATDAQRIEMVRLAIADNPHFSMSLVEMNEDGYTYTYRTLEKLTEKNPDTDYYFIIGSDSLFDFDTWKEPARISAQCTVVAAVRNQTPSQMLEARLRELNEKYEGQFLRLDTANIDISSHELRDWVKRGASLKYYVPDAVMNYILDNHMYL